MNTVLSSLCPTSYLTCKIVINANFNPILTFSVTLKVAQTKLNYFFSKHIEETCRSYLHDIKSLFATADTESVHLDVCVCLFTVCYC